MPEELQQPTESTPTPEPSAETPSLQDTVPLNAEAEAQTAPPSGETPPPAEPPKPESRFKRFMRRLLWTVVGLFVVFAAGFITAWAVFYRPLQAEKQNLEIQLQQVQEAKASLDVEKADLESKLQEAQARIAELETKVEQVSAERDQAQTLHYLLSALADTYAAQLALEKENTTAARLYLSNIQAALRLLEERLPQQKEVLTEMHQRVEKATQTLSTSPLTAQGELTALADYLLQLEKLVTQK